MDVTYPRKLRTGDLVRVIAPSRSRAILHAEQFDLASSRLEGLGLRVDFGAHVDERDAFDSSSVAARLDDVHTAFADPEVAGVVTVIGGFNANQLLPELDFDLVAANPKVFCGYSDISALQNAFLARAGLVTYSGPHWSTFGMRDYIEDTLGWFQTCLMDAEAGGAGVAPIELTPAARWTDDLWFLDQDNRHPEPNEGWWVLGADTSAVVHGRIVGGNLATLSVLQGTPWMPSLDGAILFLEDDEESAPHHFDRNLTSLLQQPGAEGVRGLVVGRFQRASGMTRELLSAVVDKPPLRGLPVLANADFGHTNPLFTFPVGGEAELEVRDGRAQLRLVRH